jgi:hypothetical protein
MGRTVTPKYRIELSGWNYPAGNRWRLDNLGVWEKYHGRPTEANLESYVQTYTQSFMIGGVNEDAGKEMGFIPSPSHAKIVNQKTGEVVASWDAPMFSILPDSPIAERPTEPGRRIGQDRRFSITSSGREALSKGRKLGLEKQAQRQTSAGSVQVRNVRPSRFPSESSR